MRRRVARVYRFEMAAGGSDARTRSEGGGENTWARPKLRVRRVMPVPDPDDPSSPCPPVQFRAVAQRSDYDTFKQMVAASHLQPINAPKAGGPVPRSWAIGPDGRRVELEEDATARLAPVVDNDDDCGEMGPSSATEFARDWKRRVTSASGRRAYLGRCGPAALASLFSVEVPPPLLADVAAALDDDAGGDEGANFALDCFDALSKVGRIQLSAKLMGRPGRDAATRALGRATDRARAAAVAARLGLGPLPG